MSLFEFVTISRPLLAAWLSQYGSAYLLLLAVPRLLGPSDYGVLAAVLSIFLVLSAGSLAAHTGPLELPSATATSIDSTPPARRRDTRAIGLALAPALALLVATPMLSRALRIPTTSLLLLAPSVALAPISARLLRRARSEDGRGSPTPALMWGAALRVVLGVILVTTGQGVTGVVLAVLLSEVLSFGLAVRRARLLSRGERSRTSPPPHWTLGAMFLPALAMALFVHLDLLLARYYLPDVSAGAYAAAGALGRVLLFVPAIAAIAVALGWIGDRNGDPFRWLHQSLAFTGIILLSLWLALSVARDPLTAALGPAFSEAATLIPTLAAAAGFLALVWQIWCLHVVVASRMHVLILVVVLVAVSLVAVFGHSAQTIALVMLVVSALATLLSYQGARAVARWSPPLSRLHPHEELHSAAPSPPTGTGDMEVSMIVPCHRAGPDLRRFLMTLVHAMTDAGPHEIIVVSDGSTDDTVAIAREFVGFPVRVLHYPEQTGKGHALRVGLSQARGAYVGFIDADGDIDPQAIAAFLALMNLYAPDVVLGSKRHPMSEVRYPLLRRVMSWTYHRIARLLFRINVRDTQTGLKVVRKEVLTAVLPRMFEKRYAFDLELLVVARLLGFDKVFEAPVRIDYGFSSGVNPTAAFRILLDTTAVFYRRYILDTYRHAGDRLALVRGPEAER